jgi:hypothetical protein
LKKNVFFLTVSSLLLVQNSLIVRSRDRSADAENIRRSIERIENIEKKNIEKIKNIEKVENIENISTQRNSSRFEHVQMKIAILHDEMMFVETECVVNRSRDRDRDRSRDRRDRDREERDRESNNN